MTESAAPKPDQAAFDGPRPRPHTGVRIGNRVAAFRAGFGPRIQGFLWQPEPRLPGSAALGRQLMAKNFRVDGVLTEAGKKSPWEIGANSPAFTDAMQGFQWLDDLSTVPNGEGRKTAQAWLEEWITRFGRGAGSGWTPDLTGRRQIRMITYALFLMSGLSNHQTDLFYRVLGRQAGFLKSRWRRATPGLPRFEALTGLIYSACTLVGLEDALDPALKALSQECAREIDASGGIVTRNPEELLEVFMLLTWVAQILSETGKPADPAVDTAIARIAPTLRSLRHADGALARAHGGGRGALGRLVTALVQSRVRPSYMRGLAMGFARLASDRVTVIVDAAPPMIGPRSINAHASTGCFEMTSGSQPVIVSCGSGARFGPEWRRAGRATLSHSTLCIEGYSSSRFARGNKEAAPERQPFADGPREVTVQEVMMRSAEGITLSHDGWRETHGLAHLRSLTLEDDGALLRGEDGLAALNSPDRACFDALLAGLPAGVGLRWSVRFHLHPDVDAEINMGGTAVSLTLANRETWVFRHDGSATLSIRPSFYLDSGRLHPRATKQIVLSSSTRRYGSAVSWSLARPAAFLPVPSLLPEG